MRFADHRNEPANIDMLSWLPDMVAIDYLRDVLSVTASVGVASNRAGEQIGVDELMHRANVSMYAAKQAGGNRCADFAPDRTTPPGAARHQEQD